ncbi:hypothetical protein F442_00739, partial [Phytophthora nicotianae P10297]
FSSLIFYSWSSSPLGGLLPQVTNLLSSWSFGAVDALTIQFGIKYSSKTASFCA